MGAVRASDAIESDGSLPAMPSGRRDRRSPDLKPPLRILMVSARFAPFVGGTEIHTGEVASELASRGHRVTVLTTETTGSLPDREEVDGVTILRVPAHPRRTDLYIAPGIRRVILERRWDIVHVQGYHTAVAPIALATAHRAGIPTVLTFHSGGHSSMFRNLIRPVQVGALRRQLLRAGALIAVSRFEAQLFAARLGIDQNRITVIPNGTSPRSLTSPPDSAARHHHGGGNPCPLKEAATGPTILSMGRLVRYKGHHRIIRAMPHILASNPDAKLLILGRGPYEKRLRRLAVRLGVAHRVRFDYVPGDERHRLQSMMENASIAVLLSSYESQGMAAHEALSAGLPLVVTDTTALSELVSAGAARAIPPGATHREVAEIVNRSLAATAEDDDRAGPAVGKPIDPAVVLAARTWPVIVDRILDEYDRVLVGQHHLGRARP